jgi:hypothetical protein
MFAPMIRGDVLLRLNLKNTVSSTRNKKLLRDDVALRCSVACLYAPLNYISREAELILVPQTHI